MNALANEVYDGGWQGFLHCDATRGLRVESADVWAWAEARVQLQRQSQPPRDSAAAARWMKVAAQGPWGAAERARVATLETQPCLTGNTGGE